MRAGGATARAATATCIACVLACGGEGGTGGSGSGGAGAGGTADAGAGGTADAGAGGGAGAGPGGTGGGGTDAGAACGADGVVHKGEATFYDADGSGNCSFPPSPQDLMVGAMNQADYAGSAACGACVRLTGPNATITIRVVDRCPECKAGDIDLSPKAFAQIADLAKGRVPITWQYVACQVSGPVVYHFKEGSNPWWTAVQMRSHRFAIAKLEVETKNGSFEVVARESYNYFVQPSGMGPGPYTFRVTDVRGGQVVDKGVPHVEAGDAPGAAQLPPCP